MSPLSYQARTEIPDGADIDRIVNAVIAEAQQHSHPSDFLPQSLIAKNIAREIKRRLCQLISVEVDLVVTGTSDDSAAPPAIPAYMQRTIDLQLNEVPRCVKITPVISLPYNQPATMPVLRTADDMWLDAAAYALPELIISGSLRVTGDIVRGSLPGPI